jgi:hypothetical protein
MKIFAFFALLASFAHALITQSPTSATTVNKSGKQLLI